MRFSYVVAMPFSLPAFICGIVTMLASDVPTTLFAITAEKSIPTTKEAGFPGVKIGHWAGLYAPKDTPRAIVDKMNAELLAVVKSREFADKLVPQGIEPAPYSMAAYNAFLTAERDRLGKIAKGAKMQPD